MNPNSSVMNMIDHLEGYIHHGFSSDKLLRKNTDTLSQNNGGIYYRK